MTEQFLARCADAARDVGQKPEDQIWLSVFGGLKQMVQAREECSFCREAARTAADAGSGKASPVVSRLGNWRSSE